MAIESLDIIIVEQTVEVTTVSQTLEVIENYTVISGGGGGGTPGGSDTQMQYNNGGAFGGATHLTYNDATGVVTAAKQLVISIATGTAPLSVASTTKVTNLNADQLDGLEAAAFATAVHTHAESDIVGLVSDLSTLTTAVASCVPITRTVNGYALSANITLVKGDVGLGSVENTALSTWAGSTNLTTGGAMSVTSLVASGTIAGSNLSGTNSGDQTTIVGITGTIAQFNTACTDADFATGGGSATGTNTGDQTITLTGDVTGSGTGSFAATIANDAVTLAKMANIATASFVGRVTASTGDPEVLTGTQATTLLDSFTTSLKGLAPASGGGTTNFLRADGTWTAPPGGGGLSDGDMGDITVSGSGTVLTIDNDVVTYAKMQNVSATARILGRKTAAAGDTEECTLSEVLDFVGSAAQGDILYRGSSTWTRLGAGNNGDSLVTGGASANPAWGMSNAQRTADFGDGSDGDLTVSNTTTTSGPLTSGTLTRDAYFNNLTINGTGRVLLGGFKLYVRGVLDITSAPANAISNNANNGGAASGATGGVTSSAQAGVSVGGGNAGTAGASGVTGVGAKATAVSTLTIWSGVASTAHGGSGAAGGAGGSGAGGTITNSAALSSTAGTNIRFVTHHLIRGVTLLGGGQGGTGGSSGAGDGTNTGGGGGGGGEGGRMIACYAYIINRGGSTAVGCFSITGGNGGAGGTRATGNVGGGGGAGGGGGGGIYIVAGSLTGSTATNALQASGGAGGNAGNGVGTGIGGNGGSSGYSGRIIVIDLSNATTPFLFAAGAAGAAGTAGSGTTGGTGAAVNTLQMNL